MALRLLIVDDHELIRVGIRVLISSQPNWQICGEATNGYEAINQVQQLNPDIVILDLSMPSMNGFEAAEQIRHIAPFTKIVIYSMHSVPTSARTVGADEFVSKSSTPRELVAAIARIAKKLGAGQSPDPNPAEA